MGSSFSYLRINDKDQGSRSLYYPHWGKSFWSQHQTATQQVNIHQKTTDITTNHPESFKSPVATETTAGLSLFVLARSKGSNTKQSWKGWLESARMEWAFLRVLISYTSPRLFKGTPATLLHMLTISWRRFLFLWFKNPYQHTRERVITDFHKIRIKHFHKSVINIKISELAITKKCLWSAFLHTASTVA